MVDFDFDSLKKTIWPVLKPLLVFAGGALMAYLERYFNAVPVIGRWLGIG